LSPSYAPGFSSTRSDPSVPEKSSGHLAQHFSLRQMAVLFHLAMMEADSVQNIDW
jgi:hypothetical protein